MFLFSRLYKKAWVLLWVGAVVCPLAESWGQMDGRMDGQMDGMMNGNINSLTLNMDTGWRGQGAPRDHEELKAEASRILGFQNADEEKESNTFAEVKGAGVLPDALVSLIGNYLDESKEGLVEFSGLHGFFEVKGPLTTQQYRRREAQEEIKELIGEFKWIEPGSMIAGPAPGEPNPSGNNLPQRYVEIKERFGMPVTDVTVKNYKHLLKQTLDEATLKKPMRGLTKEQWIHYAAELTIRLEKLFPIAYPGLKFREAKVPAEAEKDYIEYATTIPIEPREEEFPKGSREYVKITAEHSVYSGLNLIVRTDTPENKMEDEAKLKQFADFGGDYYKGKGPRDVDLVEPNLRGLKGLSGGVGKIIDVPFDSANSKPGSSCHVVSGGYGDYSNRVQVCSRGFVFADAAASWAGVRLVLLFW